MKCGKPDDKWDKAMSDLSKLLTIEEIRNNGVIVNLSEIIENKLENLNKADLFIRCDIDSIMDDIDNILRETYLIFVKHDGKFHNKLWECEKEIPSELEWFLHDVITKELEK